MTSRSDVDAALVQWGDRLFYPDNRIVKSATPRLGAMARGNAADMRRRIVATVAHKPQVMVKVTGGGRGMLAIAAHFRYISKNGRLPVEDDRGVVREGRDALRDLADQWRYGGSFIDDMGRRREAFNIMLSMPQGTDPSIVQRAAREFAQAELRGHAYVMVLHEHQAHPHVHLSVRAESAEGQRLSPRKADLHRWRETFAEKLRGWGVEAEATRQVTRCAYRVNDPLWRRKAAEEGRLQHHRDPTRPADRIDSARLGAAEAWAMITRALEQSDLPEDLRLARQVRAFAKASDLAQDLRRLHPHRVQQPDRSHPLHVSTPSRDRSGPDIER